MSPRPLLCLKKTKGGGLRNTCHIATAPSCGFRATVHPAARRADVFAINEEQTRLQLYWDYYSTINQARPDKEKKQATE